MKVYKHGELCIFSGASLPRDAKKLDCKGDYKLADSETSGNHHMLEVKEGVEIYEHEGTLFVKTSVPTDVYCVVKERHDNQTLEPGVYEISPAQEYDHLTQEKRRVAD